MDGRFGLSFLGPAPSQSTYGSTPSAADDSTGRRDETTSFMRSQYDMMLSRSTSRSPNVQPPDSPSSMLTLHVVGQTQRRSVSKRQSSGRMPWLSCVALALAALASPARAQSLTTLAPPQRVRLSAPEVSLRNYRGTWSALNGDTLVVDGKRVSLRLVTDLAVSTDSVSHGRWGAVLGAAAGLVWGGLACRRSDCQEADLPVPFSVVTTAAGALVGLILGAGVRTERSVSCPSPAVKVTDYGTLLSCIGGHATPFADDRFGQTAWLLRP